MVVKKLIDNKRNDKISNNDHRHLFNEKESFNIIAIQKTLQGDKKAFSYIVDSYIHMFYTLAYRMLGNKEDAEDAVQDIFIRVYKSLKYFRLGEKFYPWIYTIAINSIRSKLKHRRRKIENERSVPMEDSNPSFQIDKKSKDPMELLEIKEEEKAAQKAILSLKPKYREAFILRNIEGLSISDIAKILRIPEGTVKTYLHRSKKDLINKLTKDGWGADN